MDLVFSRTKKIPSKKWGQECSLCSSRHGVPIECSARGCKAAYHTTCAIRAKLKMQAIFGKNFKGGIKLRSYCKNHSPDTRADEGSGSQTDKIDASGVKEIDMTNLADDKYQEGSEELDHFWKYVDINQVHKNISDSYARAKRLRLGTNKDTTIDSDSSPTKSKKGSLKNESGSTERTNSPKKAKQKLKDDNNDSLVPSEETSVQEVNPLLLDLIYRYWMLLRTANNGQSLIKFSPSALKEREFEQRKSILKLRIELERVRNLSYMIGKREKLKASWLKTHQNIIMRTFSVINDLNPALDLQDMLDSQDPETTSNSQSTHSHQQTSTGPTNGKKYHHSTQHLQPSNGMFDESDQLINDLITCDQIYDIPNITPTNHNHSNLPYEEHSTMERRRTLSLVRRINRQLKSVDAEPSLNPYAKNYLVSKRSDSPVGLQQSPTNKMLKNR